MLRSQCAQAFWVLWALMKQPKFDLEGVMGTGLRKAKCWFYCLDQLVKSRLLAPMGRERLRARYSLHRLTLTRLPEVHAALSKFEGISSGVYAADWIFTLFSRLVEVWVLHHV